MRSIKRGLAILLAVLLIIPTMTVSAEEPSASPTTAADASQPDAGNKLENPADEDEKQPDTEKKEEDVIPKETPVSTPSNEEEGKNEVVSPKPAESPEATAESKGTAAPEVTAVPEASDSPVPTSIPDAGASPEVSASPEAAASPKTSATPEGTASPEVTAAPDASASPSASATPTASASPSATPLLDISEADEILFNTGNHAWSVVTKAAFDQEMGDAYYEEDGSYTINIPEENPFFPYEVQFTCNGEVTKQWFMTPDDSVEVGGHTFYVSAYFDGTTVTQLSLNVAGDTVIVWPEEKEFTDEEDGGAAELSLLPLPEQSFTVRNALLGYTPAELTMVSIDSIFAGGTPAPATLQSTDKVAWVYKDDDVDDDYVISSSGSTIDLSCGIASGSSTWEMIVGDADQLNMSNTRYSIEIKTTPSSRWLKPAVYSENETGNRTPVSVSYFGYYDYSRKFRSLDITVPAEEAGDKLYVNLEINPSVFGSTRSANFRIYEGQFSTADEAMAGSDITSQICGADMTQQGAGYVLEKSRTQWLTMVTFDGSGQVTGCLPFYLDLSFRVIRNHLYASLYEKGGTSYDSLSIGNIEESPDKCIYKTVSRYSEHANRNYCMLTMTYYSAGGQTDITAAYEGQYGSISEAVSAGANDIKNSLFTSFYSGGGYEADYSQGVYFTIFAGNDGSADQEVYHCNIKTEETKHTGTDVSFYGVNDRSGASIDSYVVQPTDDTYSRNRYYTILVEGNVDLTQLAPVFSTDNGVVLYASGSSTPEVSGVSVHDFSKGAVQYTAASEDGKSQENYWLQIVKAVNGVGRLYINSLADEESHTREENGIIYSTREVMLDSHYGKVHDILLTNVGTAAIPAISAELSSDVVKLDDYWTLHGNQDLAAFTTTNKTGHGELANLAKLRIVAKDGVEDGTDVTGTLTIKSAGNTLMVLTLTGTIGDPCITTKEIPEAVKYVPYGTMIQNSNKYSWNRVSYSMTDGVLPGGMEVKQNGEIYGVPTETGDFTFTVRMDNSYSSFSSSYKTYTLTVLENTDPNVDGATDTGYDLSQRVQNISFTSLDFSSSYSGNLELPAGNRTLVSQGIYGEFVDIYLDGIKLVKGTDYMSESGSTRITILTQTLVSRSAGTHTLGVEFRTSDTDELRRAAQNYVVNIVEDGNGSGTDENNGGNNGGGSDEGSGGDADSGSSGNSSSNTSLTNAANGAGTGNAAGTEGAVNTVAYTVESGDSLWKIARRFFGDGNFWRKIYAENAEVIGSDPNKLRVGMVLTIYLNQGDGSMITAVSPDGAAGNSYTVQRGDTLWKIALKVYGRGWRWRRIYDANTDKISDPGQIYVGQVLFIPD